MLLIEVVPRNGSGRFFQTDLSFVELPRKKKKKFVYNSIHIILGLKYCSLSLPKAVLYLLVIKINASDLWKEGLIYFFFALIVLFFVC